MPSRVQPFAPSAPTCCACPGDFVLPPDVKLEDCLSEDEAIAIGLTNNAAFRAALTQLGMAEGDLIQSRLVPNPNLQNFFPVGVKQWEWTLYAPIEAFFIRPVRIAVAEREYQRIANSLVQTGLDFVRDVRLAHINLALATEQTRVAEEAVQLRGRIAELTQSRLDRGDISELEASTARIDALNATANAALVRQNVLVARAQLSRFLGLPADFEPVCADSLQAVPAIKLNSDELITSALARRPDMLAADWAVAGASRRVELARKMWWRFEAAADANGKGAKGFEIGPGVRFDIPIFNRNQGGIARAQAELMQARYNRDVIRDQIIQDVRTAVAQWQQAEQSLAILTREVTPALQEATAIAQRGYENGGTDYFLVLQTSSQYLDAQVRLLDQKAALLRALAELERSIARKLVIEEPESIELIPPLAPARLPPAD